jgi:hypothetical protein
MENERMSFNPNPNGPRGFDVAKAKNGTPNRSITARIAGNGSDKFYVGQPLKLAAGLLVVLADDADDVAGVFDGCEYVDTNGDIRFSPFWPAPGAVATGSVVKARIYDANDSLFLIQANDTLDQTDVGLYAALVVTVGTGGDDTTGRSTAQLDAASVNASAVGLLVQIVAVSPREEGGDEVGTLAVVQFIRPQLGAALDGAP